MTAKSVIGALVAFAVALGAVAAAAYLIAPEAWLAEIGIAPAEPAQATGGWGATTPAEPESAPLIDLSALGWMAWTPETGAFFLFILACLATMTGLEVLRPGGAERDGVFGLTTTRGDRLFITLLGAGWIFLAWLGIMGTPLWGGLGIAIAWAVFVFWKV